MLGTPTCLGAVLGPKGVPPFDPAQLPGISLWLAAGAGVYSDAGVTAATNGGSVQQWNDLSGSGNNLTQATGAKQPSFQTNQYNGRPCVRFNGTTHLMTCAAGFSATDHTTLALVKFTSLTGNRSVLGCNNGATVGHDLYAPGSGAISAYYRAGQRVASTALAVVNQLAAINLTVTDPVASSKTLFHVFVNGVHGGISAQAVEASTTTDFAITLGADSVAPSTFNWFAGDVLEILQVNKALAGGNENLVRSFWNARYGLSLPLAPKQVVFTGDSITEGYPVNPGYVQAYATANTTHYALNMGAVSRTLAQMITDAPTSTDVLCVPGIAKNICVVFAGTNDIVTNGTTGAATYALLQTYCAARRAAGWKVVVCTMLPRGTAGNETDRQTFNSSIASGFTSGALACHAVADVGANGSTMGAPGANTNTTYYNADAIHPNVTGSALLATTVATAVNSL